MKKYWVFWAMCLTLISSACFAQKSTSVEVDLKGLKIGMSFADAAALVDSNAKGCQRATQVGMQSDYYRFGDQVIICDNKFPYFGTVVKHFFLAFIDNKLAFIRMKTFETSDEAEFPPVYKALAEKYKVNPAIKKTAPHPNTGLSNYEVAFTDKNGNSLEAIGQFMKQGPIFLADSEIQFLAKGYEQTVKKREAALANAAAQQKQKESNVKKNDL